MTELAAALARHRDDSPPRLELSLPVDRLMDVDYLSHLKDDLFAQVPDGFEMLKATPRTHEMIPAAAGVYLFVWCPEFELHGDSSGATSDTQCPRLRTQFVLYVGKAGGEKSKQTLKSRYQGEYRKYVGRSVDELWSGACGTTRDELLDRWLRLVPLEYWYAVVANDSEVSSIEKRLIDLFNPPLNQIKGLRLRAAGLKNAF